MRRALPGLAALGLVSVGLAGCERAYPLEPTFCDRWCQTFIGVGCDLTPSDCVESCEETKGPEQCGEVSETLLECYRETSVDQFECSAEVLNAVRVTNGACQTERDALYECAVPGIGQCLTACRGAQSQTEPDSLGICNLGSRSCEEVCWLLSESAALATAEAGTPSASNSLLLQLGLLCVTGDGGAFLPAPSDPL